MKPGYLGIIFHENMHWSVWSHHISSICSKANRSLNFLCHNLSKCSSDIKENAYLTIVRPTLEYAACVWHPYQEYLIYDIEKIQRRAARWVLPDYSIDTCTKHIPLLISIIWPRVNERCSQVFQHL